MAQKKLNTAKVKKHVQAQSKKPSEKIIFLTEGDSAIASLKEVRTPLIHGGYPLKGVPLNVYGLSNKEILENKELSELMAILGLQFGASDTETLHNLTYSKIAIMVDADVDGMGFILPILLQFLGKWEILFEKKIVCLVQSPLKIATKGKTKKYFYTEEEFQKALPTLKGFETRYIKGIGSLKAEEYKMVINDESHFIPIDIDDKKCFDLMFSDNVPDRKEFLKG
jgi:DNA topoisomerase-2